MTLTIGNDQGMNSCSDCHAPPGRREPDYAVNNINDMTRILGRSATNGGLAVGTTISFGTPDCELSDIKDMWRILGRSATDEGLAVGTFKPISLGHGAVRSARAAPEVAVSGAADRAI